MQLKNKNQIFFLGSVIALLVGLLGLVIVSIMSDKKNSPTLLLKQIYASDYDLKSLGSNHFIGSYAEMLEVIIDNKGMEIAKIDEKYSWSGYYEMLNNRFLIYGIDNNNLITYIFDENGLRFYRLFEGYGELKPIFYRDNGKDYLLGFSKNSDEKRLYFIDSNKEIVLNDTSLIAEIFDGNAYYTFNKNYLVLQDKNNLTGVINLNGEQVIDYQYTNIMTTKNDYFVTIDKKGNYGVVSLNNEILIPFNYKGIIDKEDFLIVINKLNKIAVFDKSFKNISGFKMNYSNVITLNQKSNISSVKAWKNNNNIYILNNNEEDKNKTEYEFHNLYFLRDGEIKKGIVQYGFMVGDLIYSYDEDYRITFYNEDLKTDRELQLEAKEIKYLQNISYINDNLVKINYVDKEDKEKIVYYDKNGKEESFTYGDLVLRHADYLVYLKQETEEMVLTISNINGQVMLEEKGKQIEVINDYVIIDKAIYKIIVK